MWSVKKGLDILKKYQNNSKKNHIYYKKQLSGPQGNLTFKSEYF